jgi:CheY-like chemotaxis protein
MKNFEMQKEIEDVMAIDLPDLLEKMPLNGHDECKFTAVGDNWAFNFTFASPSAHFAAHGTGATPREAFAATQKVLLKQIGDWHAMRENAEEYCPLGLDGYDRKPVVMIVDDDVDMAQSMETIFRQLGCETLVVTDPTAMSRAISFEEADFIILDWKLANHLQGSDVLRSADRLISSFGDLRSRFGYRQPKIITHSVLRQGEIAVPPSVYFRHLDHWQKPLRFDQLFQRGGAVLNACGF